MAIYKASQLLTACNAENTQTNNCIAQTIINIYMSAKTFYQEDMVNCMHDFLSTGNLDFRKYHIQF